MVSDIDPLDPPIVLLVHGAWHGGWCWASLQAELDQRGIASLAVDLPGHGASPLPLTDLPGDAAHVSSVVRALGRRVVLVGHSYGGAVITEVASDPEIAALVDHLVYLTAFALDQGETVTDVILAVQSGHVAIIGAIVDNGDGTTSIDPAQAVAAFYADCPPAAATAAIARLDRQTAATFAQPASGAPRDSIASTYVRCLRDESIHIVHQDLMAARCRSVATIDTDHSPFLGRPAEVADILQPIVDSASTTR